MQGGRWSSEALQAMETHLCLLKKANKGCEAEGAGGDAEPVQPSGQCEADIGPHLHLNSRVPLPHGWEQFLDLQSGKVYYVDWKNCRRSYMDPRTAVFEHSNAKDLDVSECTSDVDNAHTSSTHDTIVRLDANQLFFSPLQQEDWDLMEARGWMPSECDEQSEITSEATPSTNSTSNYDSSHVANFRTGSSSYEYVSTHSRVDLGKGKN